MKELGNILGWLGMAEGNTVMAIAEQHIFETCKTVAFFSEAVKAFLAGNLGGKTEAIEKVKESERAADKLVAKMINELSQGLLLPPDREDLMRFAKALDKIADTTNRAARLLAFIEQKPPENVLKNMLIGTEQIISATAKLEQAIRAAVKNQTREAMAFCDDVDRIEHEADDQKRLLIDAILRAKLEPADLLLCYNLAEALEGITDRVETAADWVKLLAVRSR